ncbi:hypothetical protein [Arthrobacter sp. NPDC058192]|uniref:hypothetical protein n=1 Tax=Arthrobacter sp. NPDC058192 TaxID=3346372 RepID=UPI0036F0AE82
MDTYAFVLDLERSSPLSGGPLSGSPLSGGAAPPLAEGLRRELAFEQAGPAGHWLVVYQEGPAAGEVTSIPGVKVPQVELAITAKPAAGAAGNVYAFTIPLVPGLTGEWLEFCAELAGPRRDDLQGQRDRLGLAEEVFLQSSDGQDMVIPVIQGNSPWEEDHRIASSAHSFDRWFTMQLARFHGFDPAGPPPPRNIAVFDLVGR